MGPPRVLTTVEPGAGVETGAGVEGAAGFEAGWSGDGVAAGAVRFGLVVAGVRAAARRWTRVLARSWTAPGRSVPATGLARLTPAPSVVVEPPGSRLTGPLGAPGAAGAALGARPQVRRAAAAVEPEADRALGADDDDDAQREQRGARHEHGEERPGKERSPRKMCRRCRHPEYCIGAQGPLLKPADITGRTGHASQHRSEIAARLGVTTPLCSRVRRGMNFSRDVVDTAPASARALVALGRDGSRSEWSFGQVSGASARAAGALAARGVGRGDVVMTLVGNRPEWVLAMLACFRIGAVVLPCTEQLRAADLRARLEVARPRADRLRRAQRRRCSERRRPDADVLLVPGEELTAAEPHPPVELAPEDPCLVTFTSGTAGEPKAVLHGQRYLTGQRVQAEHWLAPRAGRLSWCTAASGWSKSARNVFIAPWLRGAAALLHDARFDPQERLEILERERVDTLCMAPTEYRVIAKRATLRAFDDLHGLVAAGEALNPEVLRAWHEATGLWIRDGYGQTETGPAHGHAARRGGAAGLDGARPPRDRARRRRRRARRRPRHGADVLRALPRRRAPRRPARGGRATACAATTTASSTSRAGSTT